VRVVIVSALNVRPGKRLSVFLDDVIVFNAF
jgi:hypothetical protein